MLHSPLKTKLALFCAITLWASAFPGIRAGLQGYSPGSLALLRFMVASLCMAILLPRLPKRVPVSQKDKVRLLLIGALGIGIYHIALNYGELTVPSGIASFIISQSPIFSVIFAILFLREPFSPGAFFGMFISIIGVSLITLNHHSTFQFDMGILYVLIAALSGSILSVLQKPLLRKYHAIEITAYAIWGATLMLSIFSVEMLTEIRHASLASTFSVIYLGIFPAAIAYIAWSYTLQTMSVAKASTFLYFMPIIATILGWVWLNEIPSIFSFAGGVIALSGVWLMNRTHYSYNTNSGYSSLSAPKIFFRR